MPKANGSSEDLVFNLSRHFPIDPSQGSRAADEAFHGIYRLPRTSEFIPKGFLLTSEMLIHGNGVHLISFCIPEAGYWAWCVPGLEALPSVYLA